VAGDVDVPASPDVPASDTLPVVPVPDALPASLLAVTVAPGRVAGRPASNVTTGSVVVGAALGAAASTTAGAVVTGRLASWLAISSPVSVSSEAQPASVAIRKRVRSEERRMVGFLPSETSRKRA
jgi:hypothetical protein